jgi:hypothetical protein
MSITVAIPLHASLKWVDNIVSNVGRLPLSVERIMISDRTCVDNAGEQLQEQLGHDKRVRVTCRDESLSWPEHCQQLIEEADSEYMMLMPHDDVFPESWIPVLYQALQRHPEALLAYGRVELVLEDGFTVYGSTSISQHSNTELGGLKAVNAFMRREMWLPFRGLFLREAVLGSDIRLNRASGTPWDGYQMWDDMWVLSLALRGSIVFDDSTVTYKRIHPGSTTRASPTPKRGSTARGAVIVVSEQGRNLQIQSGIRIWIWLYWAMLGVSRKIANGIKILGNFTRSYW